MKKAIKLIVARIMKARYLTLILSTYCILVAIALAIRTEREIDLNLFTLEAVLSIVLTLIFSVSIGELIGRLMDAYKKQI